MNRSQQYSSLSTLFEWKDPQTASLQELFSMPWDGMGSLESWIQLQISSKERPDPSRPHVWIQDPDRVWIHPTAVIEPGVMLQGPIYIGVNVTVRHGAYLRGPVVLSESSLVGHSTEVKNSLLLAGATAAHFNYVGDSVLGECCNLGAGAILANVRFDRETISMRMPDGEKMQTGRKKMGALIGAYAQIGCNAVICPGAIVAPHAWVEPGACIRGCYPRPQST